jgi:phage replication O-like protein O
MLKINNHTQITNEFIDDYMSKVSGSATKVFLSIARKTIGWHKETDQISQSQLIEMTGMSLNTVKDGIRELLEHNIIKKEQTGTGKSIKTYFEINYQLSNIDTSKESNISKSDIKNESNISNIDTTKDINIKIINTKIPKVTNNNLREQVRCDELFSKVEDDKEDLFFQNIDIEEPKEIEKYKPKKTIKKKDKEVKLYFGENITAWMGIYHKHYRGVYKQLCVIGNYAKETECLKKVLDNILLLLKDIFPDEDGIYRKYAEKLLEKILINSKDHKVADKPPPSIMLSFLNKLLPNVKVYLS